MKLNINSNVEFDVDVSLYEDEKLIEKIELKSGDTASFKTEADILKIAFSKKKIKGIFGILEGIITQLLFLFQFYILNMNEIEDMAMGEDCACVHTILYDLDKVQNVGGITINYKPMQFLTGGCINVGVVDVSGNAVRCEHEIDESSHREMVSICKRNFLLCALPAILVLIGGILLLLIKNAYLFAAFLAFILCLILWLTYMELGEIQVRGEKMLQNLESYKSRIK